MVLNRDSPDGGPGDAEIATAGFLLQDGPVPVACGCASEHIGKGKMQTPRAVGKSETETSRHLGDVVKTTGLV